MACERRGEKKKLLSYFWWSPEEELEKQYWIFDYYTLHSVFNYYKKPRYIWEKGNSIEELLPSDWPKEAFS